MNSIVIKGGCEGYGDSIIHYNHSFCFIHYLSLYHFNNQNEATYYLSYNRSRVVINTRLPTEKDTTATTILSKRWGTFIYMYDYLLYDRTRTLVLFRNNFLAAIGASYRPLSSNAYGF